MSERVWLSPTEVTTLETESGSLRNRLLVELGAKCGLRISESANVKVGDFFEEPIDGDLYYWLSIEGKQTNQTKGDGEKKQRYAWVPESVWKDYRTLTNQENLSDDDYLLQSQKGGGLHVDSARKIIKQIGERAYEQTTNERFLDVSSHDLRAYFANQLHVQKGVNVRVVMEVGGWESFEAIKPYLDRPTRKVTATEMSDANWA